MSVEKETLFLLPGLLCDAAEFTPQIAALQPLADVRVADFSGLHSFSAMARSVLAKAPATFSLVGHSMGGRVALEVAHLAPERINRLCLMDVTVEPLKTDEPAARMALVEQAEAEGMAWLVQWWLDTFVIPEGKQNPVLMDTLRQMVERQTLADYRNQITAAVTRSDQSTYLAGIKQHVLLICGALDTWSTPEQHREIARSLNSSSLELIDGAGHMPTLEAPRRVNEALTRWWLTY